LKGLLRKKETKEKEWAFKKKKWPKRKNIRNFDFGVVLIRNRIYLTEIYNIWSQHSSPLVKQQFTCLKKKTLEILRQKESIFIGIPRENQIQEKRICLTPDAVNAITGPTDIGYLLGIWSGRWCHYSDLEFYQAGAEITGIQRKSLLPL